MKATDLDPRRLLEIPPVYNSFQKLVGAVAARRSFAAEYLTAFAGSRVLEVGCGPGTMYELIPPGIRYVGCDLSEIYIAYAKSRFGASAEFFALPVGKLAALGLRPFRAVFALALLHHLDDDEVRTLCREVHGLLEPGGSFFTGDPCYLDGQSRLEHFITSCDRGRFVRHAEKYRELLAETFSRVTLRTGKSGMLIPGTGAVIIAVKG